MPLPDFVVVPRTDPIYNAHSYLTKVPVGAIRPFIEEFTKPNDVVVDCFAGSGMTAVAALMSERRAEVSDISVLGRHVGRGFLSTVDKEQFVLEAGRIVTQVREDVGRFYRTQRHSDGQELEWNRTIWSYVFKCPQCSTELNFYRTVAGTGQSSPTHCLNCRERFKKRSWEYVKDVPVAVVLRGLEGKLTEQPVNEHDLAQIRIAGADERQSEIPSLEISPEREMFRRSALARWGLTSTRAFFTARNALVLCCLWRRINQVEQETIRQKLMFAFTAILPRASRRYQWGPKRPLNAQNQTYYISAVHFEWNVFELFERKVRAALRAQEYRDSAREGSARIGWGSGVNYHIASADRLEHLQDASVDYVFTDPPFGSNIFYSDMNLFQEAWLGSATNHGPEAVIHTGGRQREGSAERYEQLLAGAFREANRVLRPGAHMSVVFGNSKGTIWGMVIRAIRDAGFNPSPVHLALLDKGQRSVKGLASGREGVVTVDLVLTVQKPPANASPEGRQLRLPISRIDLIRRALAGLPAERTTNPSYIYVSTVKEAIALHRTIDDLHLSDVLVELAGRGNAIDPKTGLFRCPVDPASLG